jgi:hypothetical protein
MEGTDGEERRHLEGQHRAELRLLETDDVEWLRREIHLHMRALVLVI